MPNNLSGILRQVLTVPAQSIKTVDFKDKQPNYFHIQNIGAGTIYFSVHGMPTNLYYDMKIDGGSIATFTDTYSQPEAFIYNPSMESVNVILLTFSAPFDPAVLAQANKQISIGGTVETDGIVKGFQTSLPSGSNKIGNVGVTSALPTGSNKIGKVELTGTTATSLVEKMTEVSTKLDNLKFDIGAVTIEDVRIKDESKIFIKTYSLQDLVPQSIPAPEGRYFSKLIKIYNAEDVNLFLGDYFDEDYVANIPIKQAEFDINAKSTYRTITLTSQNGAKSNVVFIAETKPYKTVTETETVTVTTEPKQFDFSDCIEVNITNTGGNYVAVRNEAGTDTYDLPFNNTKTISGEKLASIYSLSVAPGTANSEVVIKKSKLGV